MFFSIKNFSQLTRLTMSVTINSECINHGIRGDKYFALTLRVDHDAQVDLDKKHVVFVVDISGSMHETLETVKNSIVAFCNLMRTHVGAHYSLITFSDDAKLCYSGTSIDLFLTALNDVAVFSQTNMGAGIELAYQQVRAINAVYSTIVIFTDGDSNAGMHQTPEAFAELALLAPERSHIVVFGYANFNAEICKSIGRFNHIENAETIPVAMGALCAEFIGTFGFATKLTVPFCDEYKVIVGSSEVGPLYAGKVYVYMIKCKTAPTIFELVYSTTSGSQDHLHVSRVTSIQTEFSKTVLDAYYNAKVGKIIDQLENRNCDRQRIKLKVDKWPPCVQAEQVRRMLRKTNKRELCSASQDYHNQTSYVNNVLFSPQQAIISSRFAGASIAPGASVPSSPY